MLSIIEDALEKNYKGAAKKMISWLGNKAEKIIDKLIEENEITKCPHRLEASGVKEDIETKENEVNEYEKEEQEEEEEGEEMKILKEFFKKGLGEWKK